MPGFIYDDFYYDTHNLLNKVYVYTDLKLISQCACKCDVIGVAWNSSRNY